MKFSTRRFLNELEYEFILRRIERDRGDAFLENFSWKEYLNASVDVKPWAFGLIFFSSTTVAYAVSYFMPIILREDMGFTVGVSLCLYAPPAVAVGIVTFALSWLSDRYRMRAPVLVFNAILCLVGLSLIVSFQFDHLQKIILTFLLGFCDEYWMAPIWCILDNDWTDWQHPNGNGLPSEQYTRPMETCYLQLGICRSRWNRRYSWFVDLQISRCTKLLPRNCRFHGL